MKITLLGAGAIGGLWSCQLAKQGHHLHLWTRDNAKKINLTFKGLNQAETERFTFHCNDKAAVTESDCIFITVKAFQVEQALRDLHPYIGSTTPVIIMHNGMGTQQMVHQLLPNNPIIYATTSQAAFKSGPRQVNHTGIGQTWMGAENNAGNNFAFLVEVFNQALAPCQWHQDISQPLWQKLAINCAINPLTASHQCQNGKLARPEFNDLLTQICQEVATVMSAEGYRVKASELRQQVDGVIKATATNFSSMNQDICQQRPTEIDYITGYLIARAKVHDIPVPVNTQLWQQIKQLEQEYNDE
ncbi:2-dehydropantoate 2-reductase [Photobacterium lipolyticum]|uniref:2-dehydropantoate 2-reductase n=1 Tax=Photobacterium lipolyticum TaxID=266810 RepID=A0A2T3MT44_9GAMM|nr:2-dehydropantoate 2-reductase [Photobacterium lipolyticum]PSW02085.1 2-dehydropantoate 2-reductase [Photobacterium lipolyticum]